MVAILVHPYSYPHSKEEFICGLNVVLITL